MADIKFREILESHPAYILKAIISQHNVKGYSKMKKAEIVELMMQHRTRFRHLKHYVRPKRARKPRKPRKPKAPPIPPRPVLGSGFYRRY